MGNEVDGAYVKLKGLGGGKDSFFMAGYESRTAFHPDYSVQPSIVPEAKAGVPQVLQQSPMERNDTHGAKEITNPAFSITALKNGKPLNNGTIGMGEALEFDSHRIVFSDLRYWAKFYAGSKDNVVADALSRWAYPACEAFQDTSFHGSAEAKEEMRKIIGKMP